MENEGIYNPEANQEQEKKEPLIKGLERTFGPVFVEDFVTSSVVYSTITKEQYVEKGGVIAEDNAKVFRAIKELLATTVLPKTHEVRDPDTAYAHKQHASDLFRLGSVLLRRRMNTESVEKDLLEAFKGKKILVLGDDMGTLSETINRLGGKSYGIEFDDELVRRAHSGEYAEDGSPQTQVMQGDIADLLDENSSLFIKLKSIGPFDAIYSNMVFNSGSGIDIAKNNYESQGENMLAFMGSYFIHSDKLLNEGGMQVHLGTESGTYRLFDYYVSADKEKVMPIVMENGGNIRFVSTSLSQTEAFIYRKGLVEKLAEVAVVE